MAQPRTKTTKKTTTDSGAPAQTAAPKRTVQQQQQPQSVPATGLAALTKGEISQLGRSMGVANRLLMKAGIETGIGAAAA